MITSAKTLFLIRLHSQVLEVRTWAWLLRATIQSTEARKPGLKGQLLAPGHRASRWWSWDSVPGIWPNAFNLPEYLFICMESYSKRLVLMASLSDDSGSLLSVLSGPSRRWRQPHRTHLPIHPYQRRGREGS